MNLNPLFFDKLTNDAGLLNALNSSNPETTHLFADIINVFAEENSPGVNNSNKYSLDQLLANINDLEITIPVNHELLEELAGIIHKSSGENLLSQDLYHLQDINITATKQSVNEEELIAFIEGLQNILNNSIDINSPGQEPPKLSDNLEQPGDDGDGDSIERTISLETIKSALINHDAVKFVLKSGGDKISLQVSAIENNLIAIPNNKFNTPINSTEPLTSPDKVSVENTDSTLQNQLNIPQDSIQPENSASENQVLKSHENIEVNRNRYDELSDTVNEKGETARLYRIEVIQSESNNKSETSIPKHKGPFILDIKTSKEISSFLSKYNYEEGEFKVQGNLTENSAEELNLSKTSGTNSETINDVEDNSIKESRLVFVEGKKLNKENDQVKAERINGAEYLRAIKIESSGKITELNSSGLRLSEIQNAAIEKDNSSQVKKSVDNNLIFTEKDFVENAGNVFSGIREFSSGKNNVKPEPVNSSVKKESSLAGKSENVDPEKYPNPPNESKTFIEKNHSAMSDYQERVSDPEMESGDKAFSRQEDNNSKSTDTEQKNNTTNKVEGKQNFEHIIKNDAGAGIKQESMKSHENVSTVAFDKGVNKIENPVGEKIISEAGLFSESVKKIKSNEIITEINKYLNTNEKQSITFHITPKNLGTVKLVVDYVESNLQASIEVENEQVKQAIQSNLDQLKNNLQSNGITVSTININLGSGESRAQKSFTGKRKNYSGQTGPKIESGEDLSGTKKMGYNTYEYLA